MPLSVCKSYVFFVFVAVVVDTFGEAYPELVKNQADIIEIIEEETVVSDTFQQVYKLFVRSKNIAIDHTGEFLFIQSTSNGYAHRKSGSVPKNSHDPWSSFSSRTSTKRLTLLPDNSCPMFMRKQSGGISRQSPVFEVEDIVVGGGGLESR